MSPADLEALIDAGREGDVLARMAGLSETERRALAPTATRKEKEIWKRHNSGDPKGHEARLAQFGAASAALLWSATASELARNDRPLWDSDRAFAVLEQRQPTWLRTWPETLLSPGLRFWDLAHRLVEGGHSNRPTGDNWCLGFIQHFSSRMSRLNRVTVPTLRVGDPVFLDRELWRLFETEGTSETSLASHDKYTVPSGRWSVGLVAMSNDGTIPRQRLLDATLDALQRDFAPFRAVWFSGLHGDLSPTVAEMEARAGRYLSLLSSRVATTVSMALDALQALDKAGTLDPGALLAHVAPALETRTKKAALAAVALVNRAAKRDKDLRARAALIAVEALAHENLDVQQRALDVVIECGDPADAGLRERLRQTDGILAASLRPRVREWLKEEAAAPSPVAVPSSETAPQPDVPAPLPYPRSLDEAIDLMTGALERFDSPAEIEAALDGVCRFCADRPSDFERRTDPLAKRAVALMERAQGTGFSGDRLRWDLGVVALMWRENHPLPEATGARSMPAFIAWRIREVAARVGRGQAGPLLATPTVASGFIDPDVLVERALGTNPEPLDAIQSLLRIGRDGRASALRKAAAVPGEYGAALRYALGGRAPAERRTADLWSAADAARPGRGGQPPFELLGFASSYHAGSEIRQQESLLVRWAATIYPIDLEPYFAAGVVAITWNLDWRAALWWNQLFLEPLLRPDVPIGPRARQLLALALAAKQVGEGGLASDALIQAIGDGRATADDLGECFAALLASGVDTSLHLGSGYSEAFRKKLVHAVSCGRWAKRLRDVARVSPRHTTFVRDLIERALRGLSQSPPPDLAELLSLQRELYAETGSALRDSEARTRLASLAGGGKAATLARALLETDDAQDR